MMEINRYSCEFNNVTFSVCSHQRSPVSAATSPLYCLVPPPPTHPSLTHWPLGDVAVILKIVIFKDRYHEHFLWNCPVIISERIRSLGLFLIFCLSHRQYYAISDHNILGCFLTLKHRETHRCVVSTVATDALVLKHHAISIHNAD